METKSLIKKAVLSAIGVYAYIALVVVSINYSQMLFGAQQQPTWWLGASLGLMLFVISACITGSLVLLRPLLWYLDGQKKPALKLFAYTVAALAGIALVIAVALFIRAR